MVRRHAGQARIVHASKCYMYMFAPREVEPRFIRVWLQGPVLQDAAAANRRSCVRNVLTDVAQQEGTTAGARFSEIAADMSARISTTERQERDNKEAGASSAAEVTQTDCSKRL